MDEGNNESQAQRLSDLPVAPEQAEDDLDLSEEQAEATTAGAGERMEQYLTIRLQD